ncbi:hypothetical protein BSLG_001323 [Batrachochytrium salamandrivorans]|nr:hypothetical protein BSLG_001323 [Batrachochytrium salamandrivorans]
MTQQMEQGQSDQHDQHDQHDPLVQHRNDIAKVFEQLRLLATRAASDQAEKPLQIDQATLGNVQSSADDDLHIGNLLFLELQQLNRISVSYSKLQRSKSDQVKQAMDQTHLTLQNLNYERMHFTREIAKCEAFETTYQDIVLHSDEQFVRLAPAELASAAILADSHALMLSRLRFELSERKNMGKVLETHIARKLQIEAENKILSDDLDQTDVEIDALLKSTLPLQKKLGVEMTQRRNISERAYYLAPPLFVLYKHIVGYNVMYGEQGLTIEIAGDVTKVDIKRPVLTREKTSETGLQVSAHQKGRDDEDDADRLYEQHPLSLILSNKDLSLTFKYIPLLDIAVVNADLRSPVDNIQPNYILRGLVSSDDGLTSPNPANQFLLQGSFTFDAVKAGGLALQWAQAISSGMYPQTGELSFSASRLWIGDVANPTGSLLREGSSDIGRMPFLKYLMNRLDVRLLMLQQMSSLLTELCSTRVYLPAPKTGRSVLAMPDYRIPALERTAVDMDGLMLVASVEVAGRVFQLKVTVPASYPESSCVFKIVKEQTDANSQGADPQFPSHIKQIEAALNESRGVDLLSYFDDVSSIRVLPATLTKLVYCLSMYANVNSDDDSPAYEYSSILS